MSQDFYELVTDERTGTPGIKCRLCGRISWNPNDVRQRYCGACYIFLEQYAEDFGRKWPGLRLKKRVPGTR